ncbi:YcxB family protein [Candidatus Soleaferrea massiliensis]|uniref:YcxB family protein n=1 Tax=Candidatus Soleaferrea massiliensis TaxID=1470354 RepID=UPI00058D34A5|nr:YcxB family protein [Candidatus Soleaferrea massiliensis]
MAEKKGRSKQEDSTGSAQESQPKRGPTEVCRFDLCFRVTLDNYIKFNLLLTKDTVDRAKKRNRIVGVLEILVGVVFLVISLLQENLQGEWLFTAISAIIIVIGVISLIYYPYIFPGQMRKAGKKHYMKSRYLQSEIRIQISDSFFREISLGNQTDIYWEEIQGIKDADTMYLIVLEEKRCIIIPKKAFDESSLQEFEEFLESMMKRYDKQRIELHF